MSDGQKQEYLEFSKKIALEAGDIMNRFFLTASATWKSDGTPLTEADTKINSLVIERINESYPDHSILGEEESDRKDSKFTWVCDPIDGTMPFSHGLPISSFSLALCEDGRPIIGVVYDPFMKRLFYATVGGGSFCNGIKIHVNEKTGSNALVDVCGFPSTKAVVDAGGGIFDSLFSKSIRVTSLWSAVLPSCLVAGGNYSGVILNVPFPHDPAAIKVIVEQAGGKVTDLFGNDQRYDQPTKGFIASNGVIHEELVKSVKESIHEI